MSDDGLLDLEQFASVEDALAKVAPGDIHVNVGREVRETGIEVEFNETYAFWLSMLSRCQGLHSAIAREIGKRNPHATWPLIRAFAETVLVLLYVVDHPEYISLLKRPASELPKDGPKRHSIQGLISATSKQAPRFKQVYAQLSQATHVDATAIWMSHSIEDQNDLLVHITWTSEPRWRNDEQMFIACAHTIELASTAATLLHNFAGRHLLGLVKWP